jgi:hypothetical protein
MDWAAAESSSHCLKLPEPPAHTHIIVAQGTGESIVAHFRHISSQPKWMRWPRQSLTLAVFSSCVAFWAVTLLVTGLF